MPYNSITVANLRSRILEVADMENSGAVTTTTLDLFIDQAIADYTQALDEAEWSIDRVTITGTTDANGDITLSPSVHKILLVMVGATNQLERVERLQAHDRHLVRAETSGVSVTVEALPEPADIGAGSFSYVKPGLEFVVYAAAAKCIAREQRDNSFELSVAADAKRQFMSKAPRPVIDAMDFPDDRYLYTWTNSAVKRFYRLEDYQTLRIYRSREELYGSAWPR